MDEKLIAKILVKLVGKDSLAYAFHEDGTLSVVDRKGRKHLFNQLDYEHLLPQNPKTRSELAGTAGVAKA